MERIQEIEDRLKGKGVVTVNHYISDIEYLLAENKRLREALAEIEDESSHEDADITRINGVAQDALREDEA